MSNYTIFSLVINLYVGDTPNLIVKSLLNLQCTMPRVVGTGWTRIFGILGGKVAEAGRHEELLARGDLYAEMCRAQSLDREV